MPEAIRGDLLSAYADMTMEGENAVAVRSSTTVEDLPDASFAGQQETVLNVQGTAALIEAVKGCWASLWTVRAVTYRLKQNIAPADVSLAVVVQKQIAADVIGVAFSLNSHNNCYDETVIKSNFGRGETVVSGQVTPDTFVVNTVKQEILEIQIAAKSHALVGKAGGGIEEQAIEESTAHSLDDGEVIAVAELDAKDAGCRRSLREATV